MGTKSERMHLVLNIYEVLNVKEYIINKKMLLLEGCVKEHSGEIYGG